jgi:3-phenylpropionate/trans-cinnamate dioxygenase ferredoxin subunit
MMADVEITVTENGPYKIQGPIELFYTGGVPIEAPGNTIFLCRCGGSTNKPFCDGTHSQIGFEGAMRAVEEQG